MTTFRRERANSFILEQLTLLLRDTVRDPRVDAVTLTEVDLTPDRRVARVYVSAYDGDEALQAGIEGLESAKGVLRKALSQLLHWRFTPHLEFRADRSWEYGQRIDALLEQIAQDTPAADAEAEAGPAEDADDDATDD
jgi:ribosome-binding factor A